jgi:hypothetical protein
MFSNFGLLAVQPMVVIGRVAFNPVKITVKKVGVVVVVFICGGAEGACRWRGSG